MPSFARIRAGRSVISWPSNSIFPDDGGKSPEITLKSVVLPAPFGPRIARRSPYATSRSTSRTAWRPPNRRPIPRSRRIGSASSAAAASVTLCLRGDLRVLCLADPRQAPLHARRGVASRRRRRRGERAAERLVDIRDVAGRLDRQLAALEVELLVVDGDDSLVVLVELDLAVRGRQDDLLERCLERLLVARKAPLHGLQTLDQAPRVDEVAEREGRRRLRRGCTEGRDRLEPLTDDPVRVVLGRRSCEVARRACPAGIRAGDTGRELLELARRAPEEVADELLPVDRTVRRLICLEERDQARPTDRDEGAVDVRRHLLCIRRVVGRVERWEDALRHLAAHAAELGDEPGCRRPREAVVVRDDRSRPPTELVVGEVTETGVPHRTVAVEAEEVLRPHLQRRVLCTGGAVDECLRRMLLRIVRNRNRLVTGEWADHDVGIELLHEPLRFLDRRIGTVIAATNADELQRMAADRAARPAGARLVLVLRLGAGVLGHRGDHTREILVVEGAESALTIGQDGDLDGRRRRWAGSRTRGDCRGAERREHRERDQPPPSLTKTHVLPSFEPLARRRTGKALLHRLRSLSARWQTPFRVGLGPADLDGEPVDRPAATP